MLQCPHKKHLRSDEVRVGHVKRPLHLQHKQVLLLPIMAKGQRKQKKICVVCRRLRSVYQRRIGKWHRRTLKAKSIDDMVFAATNRVLAYVKSILPADFKVKIEKEVWQQYCQQKLIKSLSVENRILYKPNIISPERKRTIRPDGGMLSIRKTKNDEWIPILITEIKRQGTNDMHYAKWIREGRPPRKTKAGKEKSDFKGKSTGNAIERAAKNLFAARMIFASMDVFPYVIFAHGSDFYSTGSVIDITNLMKL